MRTTLTLDDDVVRLIEEARHRERRPTKEIVNDALRRALGAGPEPRPYATPVHDSAILPGVDLARLNHLVDEDEDDAVVRGIAQ